MSTPTPIMIGSHVSPVGTVTAHDAQDGQACTVRNGERYEVTGLSHDGFATITRLGHTTPLILQVADLELW